MSPVNNRLAAGLLMAAAIASLNLYWFLLYSDTKAAAQAQNMTIVEGLHIDKPEFKEAFASSLPDHLNPRMLVVGTGATRFWILLMVAGVIGLLWFRTDLPAETRLGRLLFGSLILVPSIVGLGMTPSVIRETFSVLAEQGLSQPGIIGAGIAEAFAPFVLGGVLGLFLLVCFVLLLRRPQETDG